MRAQTMRSLGSTGSLRLNGPRRTLNAGGEGLLTPFQDVRQREDQRRQAARKPPEPEILGARSLKGILKSLKSTEIDPTDEKDVTACDGQGYPVNLGSLMMHRLERRGSM